MSQSMYRDYFMESLGHLATEISKARDIPLDEARDIARASFKRLFPDGRVDSVSARDQFIYELQHSEHGKVGILHMGIERYPGAPHLYIWDIEISPEHRGKGYGEFAMRAAEIKARELGLGSILLNVFGHNQVARGLYEKMGFKPASIRLVKKLA